MLLNEEISRMQVLAGMGPEKHAFETLLESFSHLTINELKTRLLEVDENTEGKAADYFENLSDKEQKTAAALASKIPSAALNLTADEFGDKVANLAPNKEVVKTPLWKRVVTGALALIIAANSIASPIAAAFKNDNNLKKVEFQSSQSQKKLNNANTADFNDFNNIKKAEKFNPSLDDPQDGEDAMHIQYKTSGYAIKDQQRQDTKNFADNIIDVVDDGNDVDVNATSTYSHQPDDPDNENKAVDGKKLDDARANSFKAVSKEDIKQAAAKKGYSASEEGDSLKIKTPKGIKTVKITSDTAKEVGKPNKTGDVDQGTVVKVKVKQNVPDKVKAIWQNYVKNPGLPRMPKGDTPNEPTSNREPITLDIPPSVGDSNPEQAEFLNKQNLNRNQEIFSVLKMANPNIKGDPSDRSYKSWDDNVKKVVISLRKSPDTLLNKFKAVTGIEIPKRQKSTGIFKRSGVAESILFETLFNEAAIDTTLANIGVSDDAIKKNKVEVMAMLAKMYNLKSTDIPNFSKLTPAEQTQFKTITGEIDNTSTSKEKIASDVQTIKSDFENNTSVKTALSRIDTSDDFKNLILQMSQFVSANLRKDKINLRAALYDIANQLKGKKMQEDYSFQTADSESAGKAIEAAKTLAQHLQKINTREEFAQLIKQILPYIDPKGKITQDKSRLVNIVYTAANQIDKFIADRDKSPAHRPGGLG
jgi:hypothetical protein